MGTKKLAAICVALAGCASYPPPNEGLATSVGAVHGAQEAGAEQLPDAALHLRLAEEENDKAKQLMSEGENERATYMTERARADAELALALAHEEKARERARSATASLDQLNAQTQDMGNQQPMPGNEATPDVQPTTGSTPSQPSSSTPSQPSSGKPSQPSTPAPSGTP